VTDTQQPAGAPLNQEVERGKEQEKSQTNLKSCMKMTWPDAVPRWDVGSRFCIHLPSLLSDAITAVRCHHCCQMPSLLSDAGEEPSTKSLVQLVRLPHHRQEEGREERPEKISKACRRRYSGPLQQQRLINKL